MDEFKVEALLREIRYKAEFIVGSYTDDDCPIRERAEVIVAVAEELLERYV